MASASRVVPCSGPALIALSNELLEGTVGEIQPFFPKSLLVMVLHPSNGNSKQPNTPNWSDLVLLPGFEKVSPVPLHENTLTANASICHID